MRTYREPICRPVSWVQQVRWHSIFMHTDETVRLGEMDDVLSVLAQAKALAKRYRELTGKPLGLTGECAEYEAARILGLKLTPARTPGYDATETVDAKVRKLQIKGRCVLRDGKSGQRMGSINPDSEFDAVLLVILDPDMEAVEIIEAARDTIIAALLAPGSRARNERGQLGVSKFRSIGHVRWRRS